MLKYLSPFLVIAGLVFVGVQAMDKEWLAGYEKNTGKHASQIAMMSVVVMNILIVGMGYV